MFFILGDTAPGESDRDPCGTFKPQVLTNSKGTITSPNYPADYGGLRDCSWLIETDHQRVIKLEFNVFHTENRLDNFILNHKQTLYVNL